MYPYHRIITDCLYGLSVRVRFKAGKNTGEDRGGASEEEKPLLDMPGDTVLKGEFTQAKGKEVMDDFLSEYKDIDVGVSENDNMTFGAIEAIESSGKSRRPGGDIIVISFDASMNLIEILKNRPY